MGTSKDRRKYFCILFTFLTLFVLCSYSILNFPVFAGQETAFQIDWKKADECRWLKDKYRLLSNEYEKLSHVIGNRLFEPSMTKEEKEEIHTVLEEYIKIILPMEFQKWAYEQYQPTAVDIFSKEKIEDILSNISKFFVNSEGKKEFQSLSHEYISAYASWKGFSILTDLVEETDLIFYEDFESGNLDRWLIIGGSDNISLDSSIVASGNYALKLKPSPSFNPIQLIHRSIRFFPTKLKISWKAWFPAVERKCVQCAIKLEWMGLDLAWRSTPENNSFFLNASNNRDDLMLKPRCWHHFTIIIDYEKGTFDIEIDNHQVSEKFPISAIMTKFQSNIIDGKLLIQSYDFFNEPAWIDDISISYVH